MTIVLLSYRYTAAFTCFLQYFPFARDVYNHNTMEMFNYILPTMLKNWTTNPDSDEQDIVAENATKKQDAVDEVSVGEVAKYEATEQKESKTKRNEDEERRQRDVEDGATEQKYVEDGATEQRDEGRATDQRDKVGATELRDVEDGATKQKYVEDGATEQRDEGRATEQRDKVGATEWRDVEDGATEQKYVEDRATEWSDVEDEATEWRYVEDGAKKQTDGKDGNTEWRDIEDGVTEWRNAEDGATEQIYVEDGATEWGDGEDVATEQTDVKDCTSEQRYEDGASQCRDEDGATEWKEDEDEATEWIVKDGSVEELKVVGDENTKCEKCKGDGTECEDVDDEEAVFKEAAKDPVHKIGHLICKRVTEKNGTKTRKGQRAWKPFKAVLQGMILYLQKVTRDLSKTENAIQVHRALVYAIDCNKRPHVLCLKTADLQMFYLQAESEEEQASWITTLNSVAGFTCPDSNETETKNKTTTWKVATEKEQEEEDMGMEPIHKIGFVICKRVTDKNETKTRKHQRAWKPFNAVLQGMILLLKTDTPGMSKTVHAIRVNHALAYPIDYKKRKHVLCLRTADRRHFFFQAESKEDQASWTATINCIAACYSAPPHIPVSHDKMSHCPQFLPSFSTHLSLEQQLEFYTYQFLKVSKHLSYYNSLPFKEGTLSVGYMLQEVKRYETYVRELQKLVAAKDAGEGCSDLESDTTNRIKTYRCNFIDSNK